MSRADGMTYAPKSKPQPVVGPGEFIFAATALEHGHIYGMCNGLTEAGGTLRAVYDPNPDKVAAFQTRFPDVRAVCSLDELLADSEVRLVAAAAVPDERGPLGVTVMNAGKDYFTDKAPFTTLEQLSDARRAVAETGRKYAVYYSERLHSECAVAAGELIREGAIGQVVQVLGLGPHRLNAASRPPWFFERRRYGGILCDLGSHQLEGFLFFTGAENARLSMARTARQDPRYPELETFGEASLVSDTGASGYFRVDWLTPEGLSTWGDGRTFVLGTEGYLELRKYVDIARAETTDHLYLVDKQGERHLELAGRVGYPFFGGLILDSLHRTEHAMTQAHAFKAAELCLKAQALADTGTP